MRLTSLMRLRCLKLLDKSVGVLLVSLLSTRRQRSKSGDICNILFIRPGGIGDAVLLIPAIRALRNRLPGVQIDVLCEERNAGIFKLVKDLNGVYLYDRGKELIKCLRNSYEAVIDTEQWHRLSAVVAYLTNAPVRIGFDTNERGKLFTYRISYSHDDYEVYSFFHLIEPLINEPPSFDPDGPFIDVPSALLSSPVVEGVADTGRLAAIFPGASVYERRWGGEKYGKVAQALIRKGFKVLILGSHTDRREAEIIRTVAPDSLDLAGRTSLTEVAAILKKCKLLITADSGLLHLAYGVGTPTVSLFGSGIEKKWAPRGRRHIVLSEHLGCSPCTKFGYTPRCKRNAECLSLISVEKVIASAEKLLEIT